MVKKFDDITLTKQKIRNKILYKLKMQKELKRIKKSRQIKEKLFRSRLFKNAKTVMFYMSFGGEVDTSEMIREAHEIGKTVVVPVCEKNRKMHPCLWKQGANLLPGPYGIPEPAQKRHLSLKRLDLVIVPGLAFDKKGRRLGRGKGYYDRFLRMLPEKTATIGLAFDFQILSRVPTTPNDVDVHKVIFA
ncbi:MAG: 5-formyltetrahydrofolate cyclo-ligase [Candidatus Omnitrophica bacterium]|nr:5-formyltetrahydrofolate cyclo-ligase [Candidatus Omnitrophota bacterium]